MLARVARTFGIGLRELLEYPLKWFWFLNKQVDRLNAEDDLRQITLLGGVTSKEGYEKITEYNRRVMGEIVVYAPSKKVLEIADPNVPDPTFERDRLHSLKNLGRAQV